MAGAVHAVNAANQAQDLACPYRIEPMSAAHRVEEGQADMDSIPVWVQFVQACALAVAGVLTKPDLS